MGTIQTCILLCILAYLIGSIPSAVWIGKTFYGIDVREHGSGNAGTTNTIRVLGTKPGIIVFAIDMLKGMLAVSLIKLFQLDPGSNLYINTQLLLAVFAVLGHIFPLYAQFRGGKGVATILGGVFAFMPFEALCCLVIFIVILSLTRYVSLGSMIGGLCFPVLTIFIFKEPIQCIIFSIMVGMLLIATHKKNIVRLINNEENKFSFKKSV